jgi:hypothetical protein
VTSIRNLREYEENQGYDRGFDPHSMPMLQGDPSYAPIPTYKDRFMGSHTFYQDRLQQITPRRGPTYEANPANRFDPAYGTFFDKRSQSVQLEEKEELSAIDTPASKFKRHNQLGPLGSGSELEDGSYNRDQLFQVTEESYKSFSPSRSRFQDDSINSISQYRAGYPTNNPQITFQGQSRNYGQEEPSIFIDQNERSFISPRKLRATS